MLAPFVGSFDGRGEPPRMNHQTSQDGGADTSDSAGPATARVEGRGLPALAVLALLMTGTCWVVASMATPWLVPPYLLLMALILSPARRAHAPGEARSESPIAPEPASPAGGDGLDDGPPSASAPTGGGAASATSTAPPKARRVKGTRTRKPKPAPEVVAEATWIEVGPGKFVRAEAPSPSAHAGPHAFEAEGSTESPEPSPPLPDEEPSPPEVLLSPDDLDPGSSTDARTGPEPELAGFADSLPAIDGIMPQAGWTFVEPEPTPAVASPGEPDDDPRASLVPMPEGSTTDPEGPDDEPARPDVPPVLIAEAPSAAHVEPDPTETAVDETVLDDAGPDPRPHEVPDDPDESPVEAPPEGADPDGVSSEGPLWWPHRLATAHRPRAPLGRQPLGHGSPPRRPDRASGPARRPTDPRRPSRRIVGRPRQASRTFPPRSPPGRGRREG